MKTNLGCRLCFVLLLALPLQAQNETRGFEMPMTLSGAGFGSHRLSESAEVGYPFDSGSHKMLWSRESIYQEANPEVTALARRGAA